MSKLFCQEYDGTIAPLLQLTDKLRHMLRNETTISLPTIAVLGQQSSGKSSVLEAISDIPLPRSDGMCTRVPLELQMKCEPKEHFQISAPDLADYREPRDIPEGDIADKINEITDKLTTDQDISHKPIHLRVTGPTRPNLTLVDLPGLFSVVKKGQPPDIVERLATMLREQCSRETTIILCVFSGDNDFETNLSFKLAQEADKNGTRTLGVVTKIDKALHAGTKDMVAKILQDDPYNIRLKMGLIPVRLRTQQELDKGLSQANAREAEKQLFQEHLNELPDSFRGVPALVAKLLLIQRDHLTKTFPTLRHDIGTKLAEYENTRNKLAARTTEHESHQLAMRLFQQLHGYHGDILRGNHAKLGELQLSEKDEKMIHLVPRFDEHANELLEDLRDRTPVIFSLEMAEIVRKAIKETTGSGPPNYPSTEVLRTLMGKILDDYKTVMLANLHTVTEHVTEAIDKLYAQALHDYNTPRFQAYITEATQELLEAQSEKIANSISEIIAVHKTTPHTKNPQYTKIVGDIDALANPDRQARDKLEFQLYRVHGIPEKEPFTEMHQTLQDQMDSMPAINLQRKSLLALVTLLQVNLHDWYYHEVQHHFLEFLATDWLPHMSTAKTASQLHAYLCEHEDEKRKREHLDGRIKDLREAKAEIQRVCRF